MMKNLQKSYLIVVILVLFLAGTGNVFAVAKNNDQNSVYNWGPWTKMASPAAGTISVDKNVTPVTNISENKNDLSVYSWGSWKKMVTTAAGTESLD